VLLISEAFSDDERLQIKATMSGNKIFDADRDIPDLSGKIILVTGGNYELIIGASDTQLIMTQAITV